MFSMELTIEILKYIRVVTTEWHLIAASVGGREVPRQLVAGKCHVSWWQGSAT